MTLVKATLAAAVLTSSAGCPTKEKLCHRRPMCSFLEIGPTRPFAYRSVLSVLRVLPVLPVLRVLPFRSVLEFRFVTVSRYM